MATEQRDLRLALYKKWDGQLTNNLKLLDPVSSTETLSSDYKFSCVWLDELGQIIYGKQEDYSRIFEINGFTFNVSYSDFFPSISSIHSSTHLNLVDNIKKRLNFSLPLDFCRIYNSSPLSTNNTISSSSSSLFVSLMFRNCIKGEYYDIDLAQCISCKPTFYSTKDDFLEPSTCLSCVDEPFYCYGGNNLSPKPGYWRKWEFSSNFIPCPYKLGKKKLTQI